MPLKGPKISFTSDLGNNLIRIIPNHRKTGMHKSLINLLYICQLCESRGELMMYVRYCMICKCDENKPDPD